MNINTKTTPIMETSKSEVMLEHSTLMEKYRSDITMLTDPNVEDEQKLKIVQTLNENFEVKRNYFLSYKKRFIFYSKIAN